MDQEPQGEERDDLRIGALASVIWNCNLDTKEMGGPLVPDSYIAGWKDEDRIAVLALRPKQADREDGEKQPTTKKASGSGSGSLDLNDPVDWENFTTGLIKSVGGRGRKKG